ncbi:MAG: dTDP-4-dehydrorhamnose reductase [Candidatus Doudnabacteria bacterium]|nr:dTDP-4-dehydrorhamnose reductase [Candidatus Doudnabacteria bacterium]
MEKVLILGSKGMLGGQLMKVFGNEAIGWDKEDTDVLDFENLKSQIPNLKFKPTAIINCVAYNNVDGAEENGKLAFELNAEAVKNLAKICKELDIVLVHFSTNYVFDGEKGEYGESDIPNPQSAYAKSKYQGELELAGNCDKFYLIRTAILFGPKGQSDLSKKSFVDLMIELSDKDSVIKAVQDEINSITYVKDLADRVKLIINDKKPFGVYHITNSGQASWYDFAKEIFNISGKKVELVPVSASEFPRKGQRPKKSVLLNTKLLPLRTWQEALREYLTLNN